MAISEKATNFMGSSLAKGRALPGQSLTNSPDQPYNWEKPVEISNSNEGMMYVFENLTVPETTANILLSVSNGVGIIDLASIVLYTGFLEGKWNPDLMLILMEPTMYMIIALAEKAEIEYSLETGDDTNPTEMDPQKQVDEIQEGVNSLEALRKQAAARVNPQSVPSEIKEIVEQVEIQPSLLEKVQKENNASLLSKEV
tara:strand:- start:1380 stop:1976 length:597 start_codon:yes stop_codon:yes gene_type:complete